VSLVARHLEANGIPTVIAGSARDVVEHCGVPRFLFTDFPLGNPCGEPYDRPMQLAIVSAALDLVARATGPRTTVKTEHAWSGGDAWRDAYQRVDPDQRAALRALGDRRRARRQDRKATRRAGRG
jgi:D-proline reductase (dithiol) PrdB